jgi:hypothetical protein
MRIAAKDRGSRPKTFVSDLRNRESTRQGQKEQGISASILHQPRQHTQYFLVGAILSG